MSLERIHESVAAKIERGISCHAQAKFYDTTVSYHPSVIGMGFTHSNLSSEKSDPTNLTGQMIDLWVRGDRDCKVSPNTFTLRQMRARAELHRFGRTLEARGDPDPEFARQIETFAVEHGDELAERPC